MDLKVKNQTHAEEEEEESEREHGWLSSVVQLCVSQLSVSVDLDFSSLAALQLQ